MLGCSSRDLNSPLYAESSFAETDIRFVRCGGPSFNTLRAFDPVLSERQLTGRKVDTQEDQLIVSTSVRSFSVRSSSDRKRLVTSRWPGKVAERQLFDLMASRNQHEQTFKHLGRDVCF